MGRIRATNPGDFQFLATDTAAIRAQKLEALRKWLVDAIENATLPGEIDEPTNPFPPATVKSLWVGQTSSDSVIATAALTADGTANSVRLVVSTSSDLTNPVYSAAVVPDATFRLAKLTVAGLDSETQHYCAVEVDGTVDPDKIGKFTTHSALGAFSFKVGFASCSIGDHQDAFAAMLGLEQQPLFFIHTGDFHYGNPSTVSGYTEATWQKLFDTSLADATREQFHRETPTIYTWSDHDFANNDTTGRTAGNGVQPWRAPAISAFRRRVPFTPYSATPTDPVHFSFTVGRVRFVVTDLRSDKTSNSAADNAAKTMMGAAQKAWFKSEIDAAQAAGQVVAWVNEIEWQYPTTAGDDPWGGYNTERTEIADYIKAAGMVGKVFIMAGNMHALAVAYAADYATGGGCPIPVFQAAPLDHTSSLKPGPYDQSYYTGGTNMAAYGMLTVDDDGTTCTITFQGYTADNVERVSYSFTAITDAEQNDFAATGYSDTWTDADHRYYRFLDSGTFTVSSGGTAEYLVAGGGGAGGFGGAGPGGGGGGGVVDSTTDAATVEFAVGSYDVTVGDGGLGANVSSSQTSGSPSFVQSAGVDLLNSAGDALRALGGGYGGYPTDTLNGADGGSGGGGGANTSVVTSGGTGTAGQGHDGGDGWTGGAGNRSGGGGGGAGAAGETPVDFNAGNGGDGRQVWGSYYGGGGGGCGNGNVGAGGLGGGGNGNKAVDAGRHGVPNTGGGGGATGMNSTHTSGDGGKGVVVIRVPLYLE